MKIRVIRVHYSTSAGPAQEVVQKIQALGVQAVASPSRCDSKEFGTIFVNAALKAFKTSTIDIIVDAGGATVHPSIADVPSGSWDQIYDVNVRATFQLIQAVSPHMKSGGRIINIVSVVAKTGSKMLTVYASSKAALTSMTVSLAEELGPQGITINTVAPGPIATEISVKGSPIFEKLERNGYIKREGTPQEVAHSVLWLTSLTAGYITGQLIPVDGGIDWP